MFLEINFLVDITPFSEILRRNKLLNINIIQNRLASKTH